MAAVHARNVWGKACESECCGLEVCHAQSLPPCKFQASKFHNPANASMLKSMIAVIDLIVSAPHARTSTTAKKRSPTFVRWNREPLEAR